MYSGAKGAGVVAATGAAVVTTLPNTGSSLLVAAALAVAAGMLTWGVVYARAK